MEALIILAIAAGYVFAVKRILFDEPKETNKDSCPPHQWVWEKQPGEEDFEFLKCRACGNLPGSSGRI